MKQFPYIFLFIIILAIACKKESNTLQEVRLEIPDGFPTPEIPENNPITQSKINLGKRLFYDTALSIDSTIACGSCHKQEFAFADNKSISPGIEGKLGFRNAPSLANVTFVKHFNKDGGVPTLDFQALVPIEDEFEMGITIQDLAKRLNEDPTYKSSFENNFGDIATAFTITRALAAFQRTMISGNSKYDKVMRGEATFSAQEQRGYDLFTGEKAKCSTCHSGFNFTNGEFINNGLYLDYSKDTGRQRVTIDSADIGKFRVPSLRNVELTAPYMHDGSLANLEDVIAHYKSGGQPHPNKSPILQPIVLNGSETADLLIFLKTLTDTEFINNSDFR
jgi:cytochrome c peroxidase